MSVTLEGLPWFLPLDRQAYRVGQLIKEAGDATPAYNLTGRLYLSSHEDKPWLLLSVPNALVRGVFDAMHEPGVELPLDREGRLNAHISVIRPEEIELVGGPDKFINDRGKPFRYTISRLMEVEPDGWPEMAKVWFLTVHSVDMQMLRRSHGLTSLPKDGKFDFHITVARRRKAVLGRNEVAKETAPA